MKSTPLKNSKSERNDITLVLDCPYLCYQAFWTMGSLRHDGVATGVIFGFLSRILGLAQAFNTSDVWFCWDSKWSYRKEQLPCYKSGRVQKEIDPDLMQARKQFKVIRKDILPRIGLRQVVLQYGLEADDMIAELVVGNMGNYVIVSADEDLLQLLCNNVRMYIPSKKMMMTSSRFKEEFFIQPGQWAEAKCLMGCKSDNVPGIRGIGQVAATKYLNKILTWKSKSFEKIEKERNKVLEQNWPIIKLPHVQTQPIDKEGKENWLVLPEFKAMCEEYGFDTFLTKERLAEWVEMFSTMRVKM